MTKVNPYISFNGNAEEAFDFYRSVFGGDLETVMRWGDNPQCAQMPETEKNKIMHIAIKIGDSVIMGSDYVGGPEGEPYTPGNNFTVALAPESKGEADRLFAGLSAGGKVFMPMTEMFWGGYFGAFADKFGMRWLINQDNREGQQG
jgi:PhnB protein